jgi:RNA polymerase sigma factor (sigma-70 family)
VQDREIVAAIVAGQPGGLAAAYDRYAQALHAYCCTMLGEPSDAADTVQDTFVIAAAKLGGLRDPDRLRPWLYAVARNECHRRLRGRASAAPLDEAGEMADDAPEVGVGAEQAELRRLVRSALGGLNPSEREIIELNLRHELDGADLAAALGVPRNQAHALASRARTQFETALGALLVARSGQESCPNLAGLLDGWDGELTVLLRKRINRHIENCDICGERKRRELSPAALLSLLPVALLPAGLRHELFRLVADRSPVAAEHRDLVVQRAGPMGPDGFPVPVGWPAAPRRVFSRTVLLTGAAAVALLMLGGAAVFAADLLHHGGPAPAALSTPAGGGSASGAAVATGTATSDPGRHHDRSAPHTAASTPAPAPGGAQPSVTQPATTRSSPAAPSPTPSASRSRSASPSPSPTQPPGTLTPSTTTVELSQPATGGPYSGTFTLTAVGGPVTFSITDSTTNPSPPGDLSISPATGSLAAGKSVTVTVTVVSATNLPYDTGLTVDPGGLAITVLYPPSG